MVKKRILSALAAVVMMLSLIPDFAFAAPAITVTAEDKEIPRGTASASVDVTVSNNPGLAVLGFDIEYDSSVMKLTSVAVGNSVFSSADVTAGNLEKNPYTFSALNAEADKTGNGLLATLNFAVNADCPAGTYDITLTNGEAYNIDEDIVDVILVKGSIKVTNEEIEKKIKNVTFADKEFTYDGTEKQIVVSGKLPSGATVEYTDNKGTDADTYNATAVVKASGYEDLTLNAKMTIKPKKLTVAGLAAESKTYDGTINAEVKGGSLSGKVTGDDVDAAFPTTGTFKSADVGNNIAVSVADITLNGSDKDNYTLTQPTGLKANITKASVSVKADDVTIIQGETIPALTYTITSGQLFGDDEITGTPKTAANGTKLGTFDITKGTLAVSSNYNLTFAKGTLTVVDKTPQNITVSDITEKTYGDSSFEVTVTPDGTSQLNEFTFESSNTDVADIDADGTVTIKAAGETDITVKQAGNDEYAPFTETQKLLVNKKAVTIISINADEKSSVVAGVLAEDTAVALDFNKLNIEVLGAVSETASNVTFTNFALTGEKSENYTVSTESLDGIITNDNVVTVTITATNGTVTGAGAYVKGSSVTVTVKADSGYTFSSWYVGDVSVSRGTTYTFAADADTDIVAEFKKRSSGNGGSSRSLGYSVKFDTDGGTKVENQTVTANALLKEPEEPKKEGYIFKGWYTSNRYTEKYDFSNTVTNGFTLYALWERDLTDSQIVLTIDKKEAVVFGKSVTNDVAPVIRNDRTMLPARFVAENLGATVEWDNDARQVIITKDDIKIVITIGSDKATVNGREVTLESPAFIENERTYTPIRFVAESLGAKVEWNSETKQVVITK